VEGCRSKDEVKAVLAAEFGDDVLAVPGDDGFDLAAYLVPALAILLAGGAVGASALRWRRARATGRASDPEPAPPSGDPPRAAAARRLESDLERYEL